MADTTPTKWRPRRFGGPGKGLVSFTKTEQSAEYIFQPAGAYLANVYTIQSYLGEVRVEPSYAGSVRTIP